MVGVDRADLKKQMNARPRSRYLVLKKVPPQQADLIMKGNFQGVYAEKLTNAIIRSHNQMPKLLV